MSAPRDRIGVFLVDPRHDEALCAARARVEDAFVDPDGVVGPPAWYQARHDLFELLLQRAAYSRVLDTDATESLAALVTAIDGRKRGRWDAASPIERRELVRKHVHKVADPLLRAAIDSILAHPAAGEAGLWTETENALPDAAAEEEGEVVEPQELAHRVDAYIADADRRWTRTESSYHAYLCELPDEDARHAAEPWQGINIEDTDAVVASSDQAAGRARFDAIECREEAVPEIVQALEELCHGIEVPALARNIYTAAQARDLLAWLETQRKSAALDVIRGPLRRAVEHGNGFAIVFHAS